MKKNQLFQFSLTVICSMVLAACGSSGGSSNPTTQATNTTPAANTPTTTPATTPAANPTSEIANGANEVADKDATPLVAYEVDPRKFVGYKHVNKQSSNLIINTSETADVPVGMNVEDPNQSFDNIVVAEPKNPTTGKTLKVGYLEDFDFRRNHVDNSQLPEGVAEFKPNLHVGKDSTTVDFDNNTGKPVPDANQTNVKERPTYDGTANTPLADFFGKDSKTKTSWMDKDDDVKETALVYAGTAKLLKGDGTDTEAAKNDAVRIDSTKLIYNYTDTHFLGSQVVRPQVKTNGLTNGVVQYATDPKTGEVILETAAIDNDDKRSALSRIQLNKVNGYENVAEQNKGEGTVDPEKNNVAEVYGYRTFAYEGQYDSKVNDSKVNNLPLENKRLQNVQYGRVTTNLNGHSNFDEFRKGVNLGSGIDTYVVDYGKFGETGTEDHYFYRGINGISEKQLADLKTNTDNGILKYWGHAVSYNLKNDYDGSTVSADAPTAIGAVNSLKFVSGNHAHAWIDLSRNHVEGSIYNTWFKEGTKPGQGTLVPVDLVKFKGTLGANGNIAGESELTYKDSKGVFGASLYGANAEEMGGVVASHDKTEKGKWGAVFGAISSSASEIQNATNRRGLSTGN